MAINTPIRIEGRYPLCGSVKIQGSKNASLPILAACILVEGRCIINNCPDITDVSCMLKLLESAGCSIERQGESIIVDAANVREYRLPGNYVSKMRSSFILMGALLGRMGEAGIDYPGGCVIGERPIDLHLMALEKLGAVISTEGNYISAKASELHGADIVFPFSSVGATQNAVLASVLAKGTTRIFYAAKEPEVVALCEFLNLAGADIIGIGTSQLIINGVDRLHGADYRIMPDRIVAGTYLFGAMAAGGDIVLNDAPVEQLSSVLAVIKGMGGHIKEDSINNTLSLHVTDDTHNVEFVETGIYPQFPTDLQSPLLAAACMAQGTLVLRENIFSGRFKIMEELLRMGADIEHGSKENVVVIHGGKQLEGRNVIARELRGGAALVIAGIAAKGLTIVTDTCYIRRGYEDIVGDFNKLGVCITETKI